MPALHGHLAMGSVRLSDPAMGPARLGDPVVASLLDDRHGGFAVLCVRSHAGRSPVVKIVADLAAREDLRRHQLGTHMSLLVAQEKLV